MSKTLRTAGMVVAAVALVAATAGAAAPAVAATATSAATAGGIAGVSAATLTAIGAYGGLAAGVLSAVSAATAPGLSSQGSQTNFTTNPQSGLPYAMGRTRMSGLRIYANTNTRPGYTKFNDLLWFGALLSIGGQIDSIEKFTADNEVVTFDATGNANGTYRDYQGQKIHLGGSPMASALALSLGGGTAPGWTSQHKLSGITHAMWCLRYNKQGEMYGAGAPEPAWIGKWVKVYDPRLDSTYPGGSGACRALQESTYVWSDNPGLHALTWALGRWQNGKRTCGIGAPVANIRVAEFVECANVCDANAWKVGGVEWTTDSKWDTLKRILQAGGAVPTQTAAMIGCLVSMPRTAIATIESRHLHDNLSIAATKSRRDRFNTVIPRYVDEDSDWSVISGTAVTVPDYVTADKGQRTKEIDFPLVQVFSGAEAKQPGQLAAYEIVNSREAGPWSLTVGPEFIGLQTGDVVNLNVPEEGLDNQPVLIKQRGINPATGKVTFTVETETFAKHAFALGETTTPPAPWSPTAPDLKPPAPVQTEWSVSGTTSGEGFPALLVAGESEMPSADAIVIDYRLHALDETQADGWTNSAILSAVDAVRHVIAPLESQTAYDVRISYRVGVIDGDTTIFEQVVTGVGKITTIENHLEDQDEQLAQLDTDIAQATINIAAAQATIVQMQTVAAETKAELEADIASINATADQIQADAAATRASLATAQADIIAAGGRIDTIETTLGDQNASITSLAQTVSNHTGRLASIDTTLTANGASINQNAQAISAVQGDLASLSNTVSTQGASISQNAQAISTANQNIASLTTRVGTAESSISSQSSAITSLQGSVATLTTRINAANPNLLKNGGFENGMANWSVTNGGPFASQLSGSWGTVARTTSNVANGAYIVIVSDLVSVYQVTHTLSAESAFYINGGTGVGYTEIIWYASNGTTELRHDFGPQLTATYDFTLNGEGRRLLTWSIFPPAGAALARVVLTARKDSGTLSSLDWRQIKLEASTVATPYSSEAQIVQTASAVSTLSGSVATLSSTVSTQGASITSLQTASTNQAGQIASMQTTIGTQGSTITQQGTAISTLQGNYSSLSSTVSAQGSTISSQATAISNLQGRASTLETRVSAGTSPNLIANGSFENGLSGWADTSGWGAANANGWGYHAVLGSNVGDGSYTYITSARAPVYPNSTYTASGDLVQFINGGTGYHYIELLWFNSAGTYLSTTYGPTRAYGYDFDASGASRQTLKVTGQAPANAAFASVRATFFKQNGTANGFGARQMKLERGTVASAYSTEASVALAFSALSTLNSQYASLSSTVSTQGVTITSQQTAITTINNNVTTLFGRAAVTVDVNGRITGWETNNNGQVGDFTIRSDRFRVIPPGGAGSDGFYVDIDGNNRTTQYILSGGVRVVEIGWLA